MEILKIDIVQKFQRFLDIPGVWTIFYSFGLLYVVESGGTQTMQMAATSSLRILMGHSFSTVLEVNHT